MSGWAGMDVNLHETQLINRITLDTPQVYPITQNTTVFIDS